MIKVNRFPVDSVAFAQLSRVILRSGKALRFRARGNSMQPLVRDGDYLLVRPVDMEQIEVGDVLLFTCMLEKAIMHRVITVSRQSDGVSFMVQGDQVSLPDGIILPDQVLGRLNLIERDDRMIDVQKPFLRLLGKIAAWQSRSQIKKRWWGRCLIKGFKHLPVFYKYLT